MGHTCSDRRRIRNSSRAVLLSGAESLLGDSLRVYQRRIVQVSQRGDSLDRALATGVAWFGHAQAPLTDLRPQPAILCSLASARRPKQTLI